MTHIQARLNSQNKEARTANRRLAKKRVQCLIEALCFVSSSVLADSLVLRNPLLRQAPKRYNQWHDEPHKVDNYETNPSIHNDNWIIDNSIL
jgi:hypothetical protein